METENQHWTNKVQVIEADNLSEFEEKLNAFYQNRFVIATQTFSPVQSGSKGWTAIVYFKVAPERFQ